MDDARRYFLENVDDAAVVQLYADGFAGLALRDKVLVWHLYLAAIAGRDIYYDQRYAHNLEMRALLEALLTHGACVDSRVLAEVRRYTKLFWINTGPYNNLTARKFVLRATREELLEQVWGYDIPSGARTVDSHIRSIRRKLGAELVRTVHGVGYSVEEQHACT